jgi:hypothetical protein
MGGGTKPVVSVGCATGGVSGVSTRLLDAVGLPPEQAAPDPVTTTIAAAAKMRLAFIRIHPVSGVCRCPLAAAGVGGDGLHLACLK